MRAQVVVIAGPSGSGKSRLARRTGLPVLHLDDFYKNGSDPTLPRTDLGSGESIVDWDDPASWLKDDAVAAVERLCRDGECEVPVYDITRDGRVGSRTVALGGSTYFVAEGIFAQEIVAACRSRGLLAVALCVRHHRLVTFWRRLTRDLREHRKPPHVLVLRGLQLLRDEPRIIAHAVELGCTPTTPDRAYRTLAALTARSPR